MPRLSSIEAMNQAAFSPLQHISGRFARTSASANGGGTALPQRANGKEKNRRSGFYMKFRIRLIGLGGSLRSSTLGAHDAKPVC